MTDDLMMPEYTLVTGQFDAPPDWSTEIEYDDDAINRCRKDTTWPSDCGRCPARARCAELVRAEWRRHLSLEPPEEVENG